MQRNNNPGLYDCCLYLRFTIYAISWIYPVRRSPLYNSQWLSPIGDGWGFTVHACKQGHLVFGFQLTFPLVFYWHSRKTVSTMYSTVFLYNTTARWYSINSQYIASTFKTVVPFGLLKHTEHSSSSCDWTICSPVLVEQLTFRIWYIWNNGVS